MKEHFKFGCTTFAFIVAWTSLAALTSLLLPWPFEFLGYLAIGFLGVFVAFVIPRVAEHERMGAENVANRHVGIRATFGGWLGPTCMAILWHESEGGWGAVVAYGCFAGAFAGMATGVIQFFGKPDSWCLRQLARLRGPAWAESIEVKRLRRQLRELDQEEAKDAAELERRRNDRQAERDCCRQRLCELERSAGYRDEAPTSDELDRRVLLRRPA